MKKNVLAFSCLLFFGLGSSFVLAAEDESVGGMVPLPRIGVEGGINLASLNGSTVNAVYESRLGFVGGAFLNFHLGPVLGFQPEVLYEQKGGKINGNAYQLDYVEIPILLDITLLGPIGILAGPSFATNVLDQGVANVSPTDVGLILGAQVFISNFLVSGRYELGLTDVSPGANVQNGTFTFLAGFSFI